LGGWGGRGLVGGDGLKKGFCLDGNFMVLLGHMVGWGGGVGGVVGVGVWVGWVKGKFFGVPALLGKKIRHWSSPFVGLIIGKILRAVLPAK
jgi:hypothetical protein